MLEKLQAGKTLIVRMKNIYRGQYLYPEEDKFNKNDQLRSVFANLTRKDPLTGNWAQWRMTGHFTHYNTMTARLASVAFNNELLVAKQGMYFYLPTWKFLNRNVYTLRDTSTSPFKQGGIADWYLDADPVVPNRYMFRAFLANELLYIPKGNNATFDSERNRVFTWVAQGGRVDFGNDFRRILWDVEIVSESL